MNYLRRKNGGGAAPDRRWVAAIFLLSLFLAGIAPAPFAGEPEKTVAFVGGTVIDGQGGAPLRDAVVVIKGDRIVAVGRKGQVKYPRTATTIDASGKFLLPGLIDMHVHYHAWMGELFLAHGVTTVKDLGNDLEWISAVSAGVEQGKIRGPRILYVGYGVDAPPPVRETHIAVEDAAMAKRAVDLLHERGVCAIKVREKVTTDLLGEIIRETHRLGLPVTGHIRSVNAREAALAGIDGLEHASGITQALTDYPRVVEPGQNELQTYIADTKAFAKVDPDKAEDLVRLLARKRVALIPTMIGWWRTTSDRRDDFAKEDAAYAKTPLLAYVPADVLKILSSSFIYKVQNPADLTEMRLGYKRLQDILMRHHKAGGKILAGSDTFLSVPGLSLQRELLFLVDAGFTPMQAITMTTRDNAQFLGKGKELGTIAPGKLADLIMIQANPLEDMSNIRKILLVMKAGKVVDTSYHADYEISPAQPKLSRPYWIEQQMRIQPRDHKH